MQQGRKTASTNEKHRALLRQAGYKATAPRLAVLRVLVQTKKPASIAAVAEALRHDDIDQATIYRTLVTLEAIGAVRRVDLRHGHTHYELIGDTEHHHIVCELCGRVEDVEGCDLGSLDERILKKVPSFSRINDHALEFFGVCKACDTARRRAA